MLRIVGSEFDSFNKFKIFQIIWVGKKRTPLIYLAILISDLISDARYWLLVVSPIVTSFMMWGSGANFFDVTPGLLLQVNW